MTSSKRRHESEDDDAIGFGGDFSFDINDSAAPQPVDVAVEEVSAGGLAERIEQVREDRKELLASLPETAVLIGSEDEDSDVDSDGVEVTMDSDLAEDCSDDEDDDKGAEGLVDPEACAQSFGELGLSKPIMKALAALNFTRPTPIQSAAIPVVLAGKDLCGGAVTGSGKTAAFMVPILERLVHRSRSGPAATRVLILLPTRELCVQCHTVAQQLARFTDIRCTLVAGGLPMKAQEAELRQRPEIVVATPGRLLDHLANSPAFNLDAIEILVLDEADRMLEQGFADELDEIIRQTPRKRQTMLFSATLTSDLESLMRLSLDKPVRLFVDQADTIAKRLSQEFVRIRAEREADRLPILLALCRRTLTERCIVFLPTKELARRVRILLGLLGAEVAELHGGLAQADRLSALERFRSGEATFLVATDVAARGLDIPHVRAVLNYNMPLNYKQYVHRIGRTARAGQAGRSITLVGEGTDRKTLRSILKNSSEPLKHRIIAKETIAEFRRIIDALEPDVKELLEAERADKELERAEREVDRAQNILKHKDEIKARPAKAWFQSKKDKRASKNKELRTN